MNKGMIKKQPDKADRASLIKQAFVFQIKLGLDAMRDLLLSPVSIVAVIIDVLVGHNRQQSLFLRLLHYGRLSDHWINLFEVQYPDKKHRSDSVDHWLAQAETIIKQQQNDGKMSSTTKEKLEQTLSNIGKLSRQTAEEEKHKKKWF